MASFFSRSLETPHATDAFPESQGFFHAQFWAMNTVILAGSRLIQYRTIGNMPAARVRFLAPGLCFFCKGQ
nr:MAG TPA: hypothetical protein [Bacteriophage sp.]